MGQTKGNDGSGSTDNVDHHEASAADGLQVPRVFATPGVHPFDELEWEKRSARIADNKGNTIFEQTGAEVPSSWSALATGRSSGWSESAGQAYAWSPRPTRSVRR